MRTVQLSKNLAAHDAEPAERTEETAIQSEIAARLLELQDRYSGSRATAFLTKLVCVWQAYPPALWVTLRIMSGDLSEVTRSYSDQGKTHGKSKQAEQQEMERILNVIENHYPSAAREIIKIKTITADLGNRPGGMLA
jgi:hypothetical protein